MIIYVYKYFSLNINSRKTEEMNQISEEKQKRENQQIVEEDNNEGQEEKQDDRDNQIESKKRDRGIDFFPDGSEVQHKVFINNKRKEKIIQVDAAFQGIFLYKPGMELPSLFHYANQTIKVIIAAEYVKKTNPEVLKRNIYGSETYTSNSDCVCIAIHSGLINFNNFQNKKYEGVEIIFKVIKPKKNYTGTVKNGISSRTIKGYNGNALKPESHKMLASLGSIDILQKYASNMHIPIGKSRVRAKPRNTSSIIPIPQTHIVFNMNNQPAYKYSILNLADKGLQKNEFIKRKLDSQALYLENDSNQKYELIRISQNDKPQQLSIQTKLIINSQKDKRDQVQQLNRVSKLIVSSQLFRLSKLKNPSRFDNDYFSTCHVPLDNKDIQIIHPLVEWEQIAWGNETLKVKDTVIKGLTSFKYYKRGSK